MKIYPVFQAVFLKLNGFDILNYFFCQNNRTTQLSERMYARNIPSEQLSMTYGPRPVPTRYVLMPMLDCRKPTNVPCLREPIYNTQQEFSPGNTLPFDGYQNKIDDDVLQFAAKLTLSYSDLKDSQGAGIDGNNLDKRCEIENCNAKHKALGFCLNHYQQIGYWNSKLFGDKTSYVSEKRGYSL